MFLTHTQYIHENHLLPKRQWHSSHHLEKSRVTNKVSRLIKDPMYPSNSRACLIRGVHNDAGWPFRIAWPRCTAAVPVLCQRKYNRQSSGGSAVGSRELASNKWGLRFTLDRLYRAVSCASVFCYSSQQHKIGKERIYVFVLEKRF